jgi:DNA-directed RNA polymerases I, II, and III subunit RPABC3
VLCAARSGATSQEIYPIDIGEKFAFALASTINADGTPDDGYYTQSTQETLADKYKFEYVMHGKVFKCESAANKRLAVYASFGGLLMKLEGDPRNLHEIVPDERIYLMIRKTL